MADIVSVLSIKTLLQDVNTSPSSTPAEPNNSMLDEAVMDRTYLPPCTVSILERP